MARGRCNENIPGCKYAPRCFSDEHHEYWPKAAYEEAGTIEQRWRNLGKNTVQLCRQVHDDRHAIEMPPEMPPRHEMVADLLATDEHLNRRVRDALTAALKNQIKVGGY